MLPLQRTDKMGKEDAKKAGRSGKVSFEECAKSNMTKINEAQERKVVTCSSSNCKLSCHKALKCKLPKCTKKCTADLWDFDLEDLDVRPPKKRKLDLVPINDFI